MDNGSVYDALEFESEDALLTITKPVLPHLRDVLNSVPDQAGIHIVFDEILRLRDTELAHLGWKRSG